MNYITIGDTAYLAEFTGDLDELTLVFPATLLNTLEVQGIKKVCWGVEGQDWEYIEDIPRLAQ